MATKDGDGGNGDNDDEDGDDDCQSDKDDDEKYLLVPDKDILSASRPIVK